MAVWDRERNRYADKMRKMGTPLMITPEEFASVVRLIEKARQAGMSDRMIVKQTGVPISLPSKVRRGAVRTMRRDTLEKLSKLHPERPVVFFAPSRGKVGCGAPVDSTGTLRRIRALRADGFPGRVLGDRLAVSYEAVAQLAKSNRETVLESTRIAVAELYDDLDGETPEGLGVEGYAIGKCATYARRAGYAPRSCWDPDTIDDPGAIPEWTGRCGTVFGWHVHRAQGIPVCPPCLNAYQQGGDPVFSPARFRRLRESKGFSRNRLALLIGVNGSTIRDWEYGKTVPKRNNRLDEALRVLDASLEDVCETEG